jgi:hypothetical protein
MLVPSLRLGSSNGFTPESWDAGDCDKILSPLSVMAGSMGEKDAGDCKLGDLPSAFELVREPDFFDFGTSCSTKPSFWLMGMVFDSAVGGSRCAWIRSEPRVGDVTADPEPGVLLPDASRLFCPPIACDKICGLALGWLIPRLPSRSVETDLADGGLFSFNTSLPEGIPLLLAPK